MTKKDEAAQATTVSISTAKRLVNHYIDKQRPVFIWGPPGVGKSDMVHSIARERDWGIIDFRAPLREPVDIRGLPVPNLSTRTTMWLTPDEFPRPDRDPERGILFLDELNAAPQSVQIPFFGLCLPPHRIADYTLMPGWCIVSAGNRQSDRAAAQRMPSALANRFGHIEVMPEVDSSVKWWSENGYPPELIAFIRFRPNLLHSMEGSDLRAFPTPRSWTVAADFIYENPRDRLHLIAAQVGHGPAGELEAFLRTWASMPDLDKIIENPKKAPLPEKDNLSMMYALSIALSRKINIENIAKVYAYLERLPREFEICAMLDAMYLDHEKDSLHRTPTFVTWANKNRDVFFDD